MEFCDFIVMTWKIRKSESMLECSMKDVEALSNPLVPWSGMNYSCAKVLNLYCKVFSQQEIFELIVR